MKNENNSWNNLNTRILNCSTCPRLVVWREFISKKKRKSYRDQTYWGKPVLGFGDRKARLLIIGLAPGAHGSNRTGRMFTGDASGDFLYPALYKAGFSNQPSSSHSRDGLELNDVFITAVCRCVPPKNRPNKSEIKNCASYLISEINLLEKLQGIVALGQIAYEVIIGIYTDFFGVKISPRKKFGHQNILSIKNMPWVLSSYHPRLQNTATGRLNEEMFDDIWSYAKNILI